jgi:hypothetical protein
VNRCTTVCGSREDGPAPDVVRSWLTDKGVTAIVLGDLGRGAFEPLVRSIGFELVYQGGGVSVWRPLPVP